MLALNYKLCLFNINMYSVMQYFSFSVIPLCQLIMTHGSFYVNALCFLFSLFLTVSDIYYYSIQSFFYHVFKV